MKTIKTAPLFTVIGFYLLFSLAGGMSWAETSTKLHGTYAGLLKNYVSSGWVDYKGFQTNEAVLDQYLDRLAEVDASTLSSPDRFAFYINAYNAWTIKLILSGYPGIKSIKDLGNLYKSPWKKKFVRIDGTITTLDYIEHDVLRPQFKDPRVHFAINCAALSCPPLLSEPYHGGRLDRQLDEAARAFINNPKRNYIKKSKLYVSKIFKWFKDDFNDDIIGFFNKYAEGDLKKELTAEKKIKLKYLAYDWSLNGK